MGVKERRARGREARRTSVLSAARELVKERGPSGTTTKQIAKRCELSEATLFFYFSSKDEILTSLLFEGIGFLFDGLKTIKESKSTPEEKLARVWRFFSKVRKEHPEYFQLFTTLALPQATTSVSDEVKDEINRRSQENFRLFSAIIDDAVGEERGGAVADLFWGAFLGMSVLRDTRKNLGAKGKPGEREQKEALAILLRGIGAKT